MRRHASERPASVARVCGHSGSASQRLHLSRIWRSDRQLDSPQDAATLMGVSGQQDDPVAPRLQPVGHIVKDRNGVGLQVLRSTQPSMTAWPMRSANWCGRGPDGTPRDRRPVRCRRRPAGLWPRSLPGARVDTSRRQSQQPYRLVRLEQRLRLVREPDARRHGQRRLNDAPGNAEIIVQPLCLGKGMRRIRSRYSRRGSIIAASSPKGGYCRSGEDARTLCALCVG